MAFPRTTRNSSILSLPYWIRIINIIIIMFSFSTTLTLRRCVAHNNHHHHHHHHHHPLRHATFRTSRTLLSWFRGGNKVEDNPSTHTMDDDFGPLQSKDLARGRAYTKKLWNQHPVSVSAVCGYRSYMEDDFCVTHDFIGVFDGHGGKKVSQYLAHNLQAELQAQTETNTTRTPSEALRNALLQLDEKVLQIRHWSYQGSTAVVLYLTPNGMVVANVGDSRAVLSYQKTRAIPLTRDHKPNDPHELARIEAMGGTVELDGYVDSQGVAFGCYRVNGNLAMSRAIGDRSERPFVTSEPEICELEWTPECDFVVLATDGLWDVMENEEVVQYIHKYGQREEVASWLVEEALRRGSLDNITVVIVWFQHHSVKASGGEVDDL